METGLVKGNRGVLCTKEIEKRSFVLNPERSLAKKLEATDREPIKFIPTEGGLRIICNAGVFENLKEETIKFYNDYKSYDQLTSTVIKCEDKLSNEPEVKVKVKYASSQTCYTINIYNTTSSFLVNGKGLSRYQQRDLPVILGKLDFSSRLNEQIREALKLCTMKKSNISDNSKTPSTARSGKKPCMPIPIMSLLDSVDSLKKQSVTLSPPPTCSVATPMNVLPIRWNEETSQENLLDTSTNYITTDDSYPMATLNTTNPHPESGSDNVPNKNSKIGNNSTGSHTEKLKTKQLEKGNDVTGILRDQTKAVPDDSNSNSDDSHHSVASSSKISHVESKAAKTLKKNNKQRKTSIGLNTQKPKDKVADKIKADEGRASTSSLSQSQNTPEKDKESNKADEPLECQNISQEKSFAKLENSIVGAMREAYKELHVAKKEVYIKEIEHLKKENLELKNKVTKLEESNLESNQIVNEFRSKNKLAGMEIAHLKEKILMMSDDTTRQITGLLKDLEEQKTIFKKQLNDLEKLKQQEQKLAGDICQDYERRLLKHEKDKAEMEKLEENLKLTKSQYSEAQDVIINLKNTLGSYERDGNFTTIPIKSNNKTSNVYFQGDKHPLSNLYPLKNPLKIYTHEFSTSEAAYQFRKAVNANDFQAADEILHAKNGWDAMEIGKKVKSCKDWHKQKEDIMKEIITVKSQTCEEYVKCLKESKDATLIENTLHPFWGKGTESSPGKNILGLLHMEIRSQIEKVKIQTKKSVPREESDKKQQSTTQKKQIMIIGNSHTQSNFRLNHLDPTLEVQKRAAMTIQDARKELDSLTEHPEVMVIHEITNDVGHSEQNAWKCVREMVDLAKLAAQKTKNVIISMGLPRLDDEIKHNMTQMINHEIDQSMKRHKVNAWICYNSNLSHRGHPISRYLARDGKHLSTAGKAIFSRNLTHVIHNVLGGRAKGYKQIW